MNVLQHGRWSIPHPDGWLDASLVRLVSPQGSALPANVVVQVERTASPSLAAYVEEQLQKLRAALPGWTLLRNQPVSHAAGEARETEIEWRREEHAVRQLQLYVRGDGEVFIVTGSAAAGDMAAAEPTLRAVFDGLRFA